MNTIIVNDNTPEFVSFFAGLTKISTDYHALMGYTFPADTFTIDGGSRYIRVWRTTNGASRSAHVFIDRTNGDVLKVATWKAPAKHARGNIFLPDNGLKCMGPYGAAYLR